MAEVTFIGAAGTVTGSKHLVTTNGRHFLVDCGMFQGTQNVVALNNCPLPVAPNQIEAIVVTHGHIDHVGYIPKIVKDGFTGSIYCTPPTQDLMQVVLDDAAHLQEHLTARGFHKEHYAPPPFYDEENVVAAMKLVRTVPYETLFEVCGTQLRYRNAGHIIGSAFIDARIENQRVFFSGDLGRYGRPLLYDPADPACSADVVLCESTYGDRVHPPQPLDDLRKAILDAIARGGPLVIPAFAVERTQDMLYAIGQLQAQEPSIAQLGVHVDSPMAIKVDAIFAKYPDAHKPMQPNDGTFGCRNLQLHVTTDDSKRLNSLNAPAIVIASSGMANGGRVLHHLHNLLPNPKATILFVGYQGDGTLGFFLEKGAKTVRIYGDQLQVKAAIVSVAGYSAHADQNELLRWLGGFQNKPRMYAIHGEPASASVLDAVVRERLGFATQTAQRGTTVTL